MNVRQTSPSGDNLANADRLKALYALHCVLAEGTGFDSQILTGQPERPALAVRNRQCKRLTELITVAAGEDGPWFLWSWGDPMTPTGQIADAVQQIVHVLTPATSA